MVILATDRQTDRRKEGMKENMRTLQTGVKQPLFSLPEKRTGPRMARTNCLAQQ